jgi:hypothetical protein
MDYEKNPCLSCGNPGIMKKARGEARGNPRNAEFDPEIGSSPLAKKVTKGINKRRKRREKAQDCGQEPKDVRVCREKNRLARENAENGEP